MPGHPLLLAHHFQIGIRIVLQPPFGKQLPQGTQIAFHAVCIEGRHGLGLAFQETGDRSNFQGRYVLRRPWNGDADCSAAQKYREELRERQIREAQQLASLTGWELDAILGRIDLADAGENVPWWKKIWRDDR